MSLSSTGSGSGGGPTSAKGETGGGEARLLLGQGGVVGTGDQWLAPPDGQGAASGRGGPGAQAPEDRGQGYAGGDQDGHEDDGDQEDGRAGGAQTGVQRAARQHAEPAAATLRGSHGAT